MFLKIFKYFFYLLFTFIISVIIIAFLFMNFSPQFGANASKSDFQKYEKLSYFKKGKFQNLIETKLDMNFKAIKEMMSDYFKGVPNTEPDFEIPIKKFNASEIEKIDTTAIRWFGHSAFLLQINGKNILLDPMLGDVPSPHPWFGKKRYEKELPIEIEELPQIDAIIISHDHYDHLDYGSIIKLMGKTKKYFVPLGVAAHFKSWGVPAEDITEMAWWQEAKFDDIDLVFAPARHFSGRGLTDRFSTLWGSWIIKTSTDNIFFSGDSGYGSHFKEIGEKYGPFDFAMMECGQYNHKWADIHMMPEQTAQAAVDVKAKIFMPIHWGAFTLAFHAWTDPVVRVMEKAKELKIPIKVPMIGEKIILEDSVSYKNNEWWVKSTKLK